MAGLGEAYLCGSPQHSLVDSQRGANCMGTAGPVQPGAMVVALAELDARVVARTSGCPHARDFARTVSLGRSNASGRRRLAGTAWNDCSIFDPPDPLRECFSETPTANYQTSTPLPLFLFCSNYNPPH